MFPAVLYQKPWGLEDGSMFAEGTPVMLVGVVLSALSFGARGILDGAAMCGRIVCWSTSHLIGTNDLEEILRERGGCFPRS